MIGKFLGRISRIFPTKNLIGIHPFATGSIRVFVLRTNRHMTDAKILILSSVLILPLVLDPEFLGADVAIPIFNQKRRHTTHLHC